MTKRTRSRHSTRRKVSRHNRPGERITLRPFTNPLALPNTNPDPERTKEMAANERSIRRHLKACREEIVSDCFERGVYDKDAGSWRYIEHVEKMIQCTILSWDSWKAFYSYLEGTEEWKEMEHSYRRKVALCDEAISLHQQGGDVAAAAHHFSKTIGAGCCVNKGVFRRLYGF